jgi:serine protease Do
MAKWIRRFSIPKKLPLVLATLVLAGVVLWSPVEPKDTVLPPPAAVEALLRGQERETEPGIPDIVDRVTPAVVSIYSTREVARSPVDPFFFPPGYERLPRPREQGMGSGVLIAADGVVLTNNHVIDKASDLRVVLPDRREFKAKVVGRDPKTDIGLLRIEAKDLPFLTFGDSSKVRVGETVLAIGNPMGVGLTVSKGIVSAKGRANVGVADYEDFLQTDAAINPGNSGGALVNLRGELVGIPTAIATRTGGFQGIGFAIPSNMAREVMDILLKDGKVNRGQMGVLVQDLTPQLARGIEGAPEGGVLVSEVASGSPAEKAGLKPGDVILKVDGQAVASSSQLRNRVALKGAGSEVKLEVWRDQKTREYAVRLRKMEDKVAGSGDSEDPVADQEGGADSGLAGVTVTPATPALLRRSGLPDDVKGLVITEIDSERVSPWLGLREGDVIVEVNRKPVESAAEMRKAVKEGKRSALLTVRRRGGTLYVAVPRE